MVIGEYEIDSVFINWLILREDVDELFDTHDKDKDGMLSWAEFSGEETKNEKAFKLMDADHNGKITKNVSLIFCWWTKTITTDTHQTRMEFEQLLNKNVSNFLFLPLPCFDDILVMNIWL